MASDEKTSLKVFFTVDLRNRARKVAKRLGTSETRLVNEALDEKLRVIETRFQQEEDLREAKKEAQKQKMRYQPRQVGSPIMSSIPLLTQVRSSGVLAPLSQDPMDALYIHHAKSVLAAGTDKTEIHKRAMTAVAAVQRERPLTAPPEEMILATLESYILKLREEGVTETRTYDSFVDTIIDVSKFKTSGAED